MINYHTDIKSLTYENFDADSYPNRNLKALTYDKSPSLIKSAGASVKNDGELKTDPYILDDSNYGISTNSIFGDDERVVVDSPKS